MNGSDSMIDWVIIFGMKLLATFPYYRFQNKQKILVILIVFVVFFEIGAY